MIVMEKKLSKCTLVGGFISAFVGYSCWDILWYNAYYHLITVSFCLYTYTIYNECSDNLWKIISYCVFITTLDSLHDELTGKGCVFDYSEYISFIIITIFIFFINRKTLTND
jgi:hypothetical protein